MEKRKQRAVYFTDSDWDLVKEAAKKSGARNTTAYIEELIIKAARRSAK